MCSIEVLVLGMEHDHRTAEWSSHGPKHLAPPAEGISRVERHWKMTRGREKRENILEVGRGNSITPIRDFLGAQGALRLRDCCYPWSF